MQIKLEKMKSLKASKANGQRDGWRKINKQKTLIRKRGRKAKQFMQSAA